MSDSSATIVFMDNTLNEIFKSINALKATFRNIHAFNNEAEGLEFIYSNPTDIVFLNLDLVPHDAVTLTKEIVQRKQDSRPFIIIYSDKQDDFVHELAYNSGIDSFINFQQKPSVLLLFIRNLMRRRKKTIEADNRNIVIDKDRFLVLKKGEPVQLPRKEFKVFELLYDHPDKFFSKTEIATTIWENPAVADKRIIDVHIYNIRQFFGKRVIQSQKGKGYRINKKFI
jgi:two-component system alkaline phosphatase synthesis response regulator PhoP